MTWWIFIDGCGQKHKMEPWSVPPCWCEGFVWGSEDLDFLFSGALTKVKKTAHRLVGAGDKITAYVTETLSSVPEGKPWLVCLDSDSGVWPFEGYATEAAAKAAVTRWTKKTGRDYTVMDGKKGR